MSSSASVARPRAEGAARILVVQFGNYAEAAHRFAGGGGETYYAQRYTVGYVADLARSSAVRVIALDVEAPLERLPSGVESMGLRLYPGRLRRPRTRELVALAEAWRPTHLLLHSPVTDLLRWATARGVATLPMLMDSFHARGLRAALRHRRLRAALNHPAVRWVSNHGPNAAADLVRIGVDARKVVPFDWPALVSPSGLPPKKAPAHPDRLAVLYVGMIIETKGVGDLVDAVALARAEGEHHRATVVGAGELDTFRRRAEAAGVADRVEFTGKVPHARVLELMNQADVVVVPSRHEYPEGMPMTIYEGLSSRSPVLVSDHPMFRGRIQHERSGLVFRASDPRSLLDTLRRLARDPALYERLSADADAICASFFGPLKWDQVISRWLAATPDDDRWLSQFALAGAGP